MTQTELAMGPMPLPRMRPLTTDELRCLEGSWGAVERSFQRRMPKSAIDVFGANFVNPRTGESVSKSTVSVWKNTQIPGSVDLILAWERACRVPAITQWLAHQHGYQLVEREYSESEKQAQELVMLRARVAELEKVG